jgi:Flp pilus assembly protein TadB
MTASEVATALTVGTACAAAATIVVRPTRRLAPRVRPYRFAVTDRDAWGLPDGQGVGHPVARIFGPMVRALLARASRALEPRSDEELQRALRQAGMHELAPQDFRIRQLGRGATAAATAALAVALTLQAPLAVSGAAVAGFAVGTTGWRRRVDDAIARRAERLRSELATVNHLLAMHARTGSGVVQAVARVVARGRGVVVEELGAALHAMRHGVPEGEAFERAAALTPEPAAARTYRLLAAAAERGADLAPALLALSEDIRDARRDALHQHAVRRRAAMLVPTIGVLAPIMLLFVGAPLPSIVLGHR